MSHLPRVTRTVLHRAVQLYNCNVQLYCAVSHLSRVTGTVLHRAVQLYNCNVQLCCAVSHLPRVTGTVLHRDVQLDRKLKVREGGAGQGFL